MALNYFFKQNVSGTVKKQAITENELKLANKAYATHELEFIDDIFYKCKKCNCEYFLNHLYMNILFIKFHSSLSTSIEFLTCEENQIKKLLE
jgi:hypothetical protein